MWSQAQDCLSKRSHGQAPPTLWAIKMRAVHASDNMPHVQTRPVAQTLWQAENGTARPTPQLQPPWKFTEHTFLPISRGKLIREVLL